MRKWVAITTDGPNEVRNVACECSLTPEAIGKRVTEWLGNANTFWLGRPVNPKPIPNLGSVMTIEAVSDPDQLRRLEQGWGI